MQFLRAAGLPRAAFYVGLAVWTAACDAKAQSPASPSCSFTVSPGSASHSVSGGSGSVTVLTLANCSWAATSDVDWVKVTGGGSGQGSGSVTYSVAPNPTASSRSASIKVADVGGLSGAALHQITQQGTTSASTWLPIRGAYTFFMEVDPGRVCGWPVTAFYWPVAIQVTSYVQGTTSGSILFPATRSAPSNRWSIHAGPTGTQLVPDAGSPGPAAAAYDVAVDGGRWEAGGPTRAPDGRGQITDGTGSGASLTLRLPGSDRRWECRSETKWRLLVRYIDPD